MHADQNVGNAKELGPLVEQVERYKELAEICSSVNGISSNSDALALLKKATACLSLYVGFADAELCSVHVLAELTANILEQKCSKISVYLKGVSSQVSNDTLRLLCNDHLRLGKIKDLQRCFPVLLFNEASQMERQLDDGQRDGTKAKEGRNVDCDDLVKSN
ncbi:AlNc14C140G7234 protein [Trichuris trichiura]|uniref:AlNc14C140G7234 protein n=1 Tax=Trichuris trichiura TaxID=36087 RepID=A0A077Z3L1_TRITR|nr:AlNc14C140G7234 protein [Trichuris trichiura]